MSLNEKKIGETLFKYRDYTPIPLLILLFKMSTPSILSSIIGTAIILLGEMFRIYTVSFIGSISRTRTGSLNKTLIQNGPFALIRNPLYVGNAVLILGIVCLAHNYLFGLISFALFYLQYKYIVSFEEVILEKQFGQEYRNYCDKTPPWVPASWEKIKYLEPAANIKDALKSERRTITAILAVLLVIAIIN